MTADDVNTVPEGPMPPPAPPPPPPPRVVVVPAPAPAVVPMTPTFPGWARATLAMVALFCVLAMVANGFLIYRFLHPSGPTPPPVPDPNAPLVAAAVVREFWNIDVAHAFAKECRAMADRLHSGAKLDDARAAARQVFSDAFRAAFAVRFGPALSTIVEEGKEPTPAQVERLAKFYGDVAAPLEASK